MVDPNKFSCFTISCGDNRLAARLFPSGGPAKGGAVVAHGLFSSMASEKLTSLCLRLAQSGLDVVQFDHSGCGGSTGDIRDTTLTSRRDEFLAAVAALPRQDGPIIYLGSSMGGTAAAMASDIRPAACCVLWSAPWDFYQLMEHLAEQNDAPELPLLARDLQGHNLEGVLGRLSRACFIHGAEDEVVPVSQALRGHALAVDPKDILVLPGADHRLSKLADQEQAMAYTVTWIASIIC